MASRFRYVQLFATLRTVGCQPPLSVGFSRAVCHALLQWSALTQGMKLHLLQLLHCRQILYLRTTREALLSIHFASNTVLRASGGAKEMEDLFSAIGKP